MENTKINKESTLIRIVSKNLVMGKLKELLNKEVASDEFNDASDSEILLCATLHSVISGDQAFLFTNDCVDYPTTIREKYSNTYQDEVFQDNEELEEFIYAMHLSLIEF